ncbi:hypothetical protein T484DRAFT_1860325 [Baffinella frigidus]|nr:hypothetical protein T484DRAFT_1860325 [Cryptophyta sp. CCMP2293]
MEEGNAYYRLTEELEELEAAGRARGTLSAADEAFFATLRASLHTIKPARDGRPCAASQTVNGPRDRSPLHRSASTQTTSTQSRSGVSPPDLGSMGRSTSAPDAFAEAPYPRRLPPPPTSIVDPNPRLRFSEWHSEELPGEVLHSFAHPAAPFSAGKKQAATAPAATARVAAHPQEPSQEGVRGTQEGHDTGLCRLSMVSTTPAPAAFASLASRPHGTASFRSLRFF